jgi:peptidoglycan/LPS O-acetylase OafA/YrhL
MSGQLVKNYGDTNFITGMRAFAAFAVVLIHAGGGGLRSFGEVGNRLVDLGAQGVAVFFVISGFSVAASSSVVSNYWDYLHKRLWRIAPLYYFWIAIAVITGATATYWQEQFGTSINLYSLWMHLSFLSFLDYKVANTVLGVEWSIPIEVFWYLLIPFFMQWMVSRKQLVISVFLSTTFYILAIKYSVFLLASDKNAVIAMHWSPIPYVFGFCLGVVAFRLRESSALLTERASIILIAVAIMFIVFVLSPDYKLAYIFFSIATFVLISTGSSNSQLYCWLFTNKIVMFLGTISYGIYLCHLPLMTILIRFNLLSPERPGWSFLILSACVILVSTLTYYLIERPCRSVGKFLYSRYWDKRDSTA